MYVPDYIPRHRNRKEGEELIRHSKSHRIISIAFLVIAFATLSNAMVSAQTKLQGVIKGRSGAEIILQTADSPKIIVLLADSTDVALVVGALSHNADHGPQHPVVFTIDETFEYLTRYRLANR